MIRMIRNVHLSCHQIKNLPLSREGETVRYEPPLLKTLVEHDEHLPLFALARLRHQSVPVVVAKHRVFACNWPSPSLLQAQPR